jgi:integrase
MAELNPKTATLREVAELYATKSKRGKAFVTSALQYFKEIADEPGSAIRLFEKDADGNTLLSKTFKDTEDTSTVKSSMQNLRQIGLTLKGMLGPDTPEYALMPDKAPDTDLNTRIFGRSEPAKAVSEVSINPDKKKMSQLFNGVAKYLDDPEMRPVAQAIIFNLNTGLRPNAVAGLEVSSYKPDTGAIYVTAETRGAKGRAVNIPLNPIADSILQDRLRKGAKGNFFTKANGSAVTSADMTKLLKTIKVPDIAYDANTGRYFDTLSPEGFSGKKGSALLRNVHATIGHSIGISGERLAYLQGRSLKAASKGSTGELATYQVAFPGAVGDFDREQAGKFASYWSDAASEAGFDIQSKIPMPEARITTQTSGFEGYFDLPVQDEVKESTERPLTSTDPIDSKSGTASLEEDLKSRGLNLSSILSNASKKAGKLVLGAVGVETARQIIEEPATFAAETAAEAALTALKVPAGIAGGAVAAMQSSVAGEDSDIYPEMRDSDDTVYEPMPSDDMSTRVTEPDTGFLDIDRVPEATPVDEDQGFLSR